MGKKKRRQFTAAFKAKVALAAATEHESVAELCRRHKLHANQIYQWKKQLLEQLPRLFESSSEVAREDGEREGELLKKIAQLTVERDFLAEGLERFR